MKRIVNKLLIYAGLCILILQHAPLQSQNHNGFEAGYFQGEPLEKIQLQTDRDLYLAGESIWFSSYCGILNESRPSPISQILYIEVFNAEKKVFLREKFKLNEGKTAGYLLIPEETPTGYYFIRAYTMYLRNFAPENYFISSLTIVNPEIPQSNIIFNNQVDMAFDEGDLDSGLPCQVALKIPMGILQKTTDAFLVNHKDEQLDTLKIYPNGLCLIKYNPVDSIQYFLKLKFHGGDSINTPLIRLDKSELSIQTQIAESDLKVNANDGPDDALDSIANFKLKILNQAYYQKYESEIKVNNETKVPLAKLSSGLNYIVIVDSEESIWGFKPIYIENEMSASIQIELQKNTFKSREKVEMSIDLPASLAVTPEMVTVSVVKKGTAIVNDEFLPEVVIENPCLLETYFEKNRVRSTDLSEQIKMALMLHTQNARSSYLNHLDQQKTHWIYPPEIRDVSISGMLLDKNSKEPLKDVQMFASVLFEDFQLHTTKTKDDGSFVFSLNHLTGKHNLYIFPDMQEGKEHELLIHNDFSTDFRELNNCMPLIDSNFKYLLEEMYVNQQLNNNFPGGIFPVSDEVEKLLPWFGVEMITIKLADYISLSSFREVINEIVPSLRLKENNNQYRFTVFDDNAQVVYEDPLVLLDNIPVTDIDELIKIHPALIEKIEVMNHPYILGDYSIWGLILITTKTDNFAGIKLPEESAFLNYQTRTNNASFVPLNFGPELNPASSLPFFNTTLYWNPSYNSELSTDKPTFYTSDYTTEFDVIVRGIHGNGTISFGSTTFTVSGQ